MPTKKPAKKPANKSAKLVKSTKKPLVLYQVFGTDSAELFTDRVRFQFAVDDKGRVEWEDGGAVVSGFTAVDYRFNNDSVTDAVAVDDKDIARLLKGIEDQYPRIWATLIIRCTTIHLRPTPKG